jgi:LacI family gluconate utilization system Gnt-I transcriptional repressor
MRSRDGRQRLKASGIPVVETWDLSSSPIDMLVGFSHREVGVAAAEYLHSHGCRAPALITADDERAGRRRTGFVETLQAHGVRRVPVVSVAAPSSLANGRFAFAQLLDQHPKIDAIFCSSDVLAQGVLTEATARGIEVPARLSVLGFGDLAFAAHLHPALTTVRIDGTSIGRTAAQFIVDRVEGRAIAKPICDIGFSIVERASVRSVG